MIAQLYWLKGEGGTGAQYTFYPKPSIQRNFPSQRIAQFEIPDLDGAMIQELGTSVRKIQLTGVIVVRPADYDDLIVAKQNLEQGIGNSVGQLHLRSVTNAGNAQHIYYNCILDGDIQWGEQKNPVYLDYRINFLCADPIEYTFYDSSSSSRSSSSSSSSCRSSSSSSSSCRSSSSSSCSSSSSSSCKSSSSSSKSSSSSSSCRSSSSSSSCSSSSSSLSSSSSSSCRSSSSSSCSSSSSGA